MAANDDELPIEELQALVEEQFDVFSEEHSPPTMNRPGNLSEITDRDELRDTSEQLVTLTADLADYHEQEAENLREYAATVETIWAAEDNPQLAENLENRANMVASFESDNSRFDGRESRANTDHAGAFQQGNNRFDAADKRGFE